MRPRLSIAAFVEGLRSRDRAVLARAITLIESTLPADREQAVALIEACLPLAGKSIRIGITGAPGVGKSTFVEAFGLHALASGSQGVAVLAVDPSSPFSGGSIMGDKTRMAKLSANSNAFIRPSPSGGGLGGVHGRTRESIVVCEAAGFDTILVETVGVGQSEVAVASMTDFFLLLMLANAGDELQGIKRGIVEMCDLIAINKSDGANVRAAELARRQYESALRCFRESESGWVAPVMVCSARERRGLDGIWDAVVRYAALTRASGYFERKRRDQRVIWMDEAFRSLLEVRSAHSGPELRAEVAEGKVSPLEGAKRMWERLK